LIEQTLIDAALGNLPTRFEKDLFRAAIENITRSNSPVRFNNFAYVIRELTRHVLKRLAPDENILKSQWYKNELPIENGITRPQRIYYAIHGGLEPSYVQEVLGIDIPDFKKRFIEIIDRLSKYTHIETETFGLNDENTSAYANQTLEVFLELFSFITETKESLSEALYEHVDQALFDAVLEETFSEIDILATHHHLQNVHIEPLDILDIDHEFIYFEASGSIWYEMQWGSNSDLKQGDGMLFDEFFPYKCQIHASVRNLKDIKVDMSSIEIDTSEDK
jgi:hypothetical protein